jgi:hypothetical protein
MLSRISVLKLPDIRMTGVSIPRCAKLEDKHLGAVQDEVGGMEGNGETLSAGRRERAQRRASSRGTRSVIHVEGLNPADMVKGEISSRRRPSRNPWDG